MLKGLARENWGVELVQWGIDRSITRSYFERNTMVFVLLGAVSAAAIIGSIVVTARDGYRRQPRETFARTV